MSGLNSPAWTAAQRDSWQRVAAHPFEPPQPLNFTTRLSRDLNWTIAFARGAVEEYRRFCFLATISAEPVTPSEEVDEVWHLHLTYSRDYWDVWCGLVLGRPLHHDPAGGDAAEQSRLYAQYAATLARYEAYFGPPPEAYWPGTHRRFGRPRFVMVDRQQHHVIPRPSLLGRRILGGSQS